MKKILFTFILLLTCAMAHAQFHTGKYSFGGATASFNGGKFTCDCNECLPRIKGWSVCAVGTNNQIEERSKIMHTMKVWGTYTTSDGKLYLHLTGYSDPRGILKANSFWRLDKDYTAHYGVDSDGDYYVDFAVDYGCKYYQRTKAGLAAQAKREAEEKAEEAKREAAEREADIIANLVRQPGETVPEYVDLGLPSGTLWATCNVGAKYPEEIGGYFAWGETTSKKEYKPENYKWFRNGDESHPIKYWIKGEYKYDMDPVDDAAFVNLGKEWRTPTKKEVEELFDKANTNCKEITYYKVKGIKVTSRKNGNSIFMPYTRGESNTSDYLTCTGSFCPPFERYQYDVYAIVYHPVDFNHGYNLLYKGNCIRPVHIDSKDLKVTLNMDKTSLDFAPNDSYNLTAKITPLVTNNLIWASDNESVATVSSDGVVTAVNIGSANITCKADGFDAKATCTVTVKDHDYVDLGLPSGTLWATCNVGAKYIYDIGNLYSWGETTKFDGEYNYKFYDSQKHFTKYCSSDKDGVVDDKKELDVEDDAAYVNWGPNWRTPTDEQIEELIKKKYTTLQWTNENGTNGLRITSNINGNSIFLPVGVRDNGYYWTRIRTSKDTYSYRFLFSNKDKIKTEMSKIDRTREGLVRPVRNK